jgi:hypothetical protein
MIIELTDAEREQCETLCHHLAVHCKDRSLKVNLTALMATLFSVIIDAADDEQQACALLQSVSEEILRKMKSVPHAWPHVKHAKPRH